MTLITLFGTIRYTLILKSLLFGRLPSVKNIQALAKCAIGLNDEEQ